MDEAATFVKQIWQHKPILVVLLVGGVLLFFLLIVDTHRYRKKQKGRHDKKR